MLAGTARSETVIAFGDSITKGTPYVDGRSGNGRRVGGYEPPLEELMAEIGRTVYVLNHGVGGENTADGMVRIDDVIDSYDHVDFILIMEGINDRNLFSPSTTIYHLREMINRSRSRGVEPILATVTPYTKKAGQTPSSSGTVAQEYYPRIIRLAQDKNVALADQYKACVGNWANINVDGTHPNRGGYDIIARTWFNVLKDAQASKDPRPSVTTFQATGVDETKATLNDAVRPNRNDTTYYFEYGKSTSYGSRTSSAAVSANYTEADVSSTLTGLGPGTTYHYRLVAQNVGGTDFGGSISFKTLGTATGDSGSDSGGSSGSSSGSGDTSDPGTSGSSGGGSGGCFISTISP